jgi:hypothetical protein
MLSTDLKAKAGESEPNSGRPNHESCSLSHARRVRGWYLGQRGKSLYREFAIEIRNSDLSQAVCTFIGERSISGSERAYLRRLVG